MQNPFVDIYRNGIKTAAEAVRMSLENSVRLQERQLDIMRGILDEQSRSADSLADARSMEDLVALQSRLAGAQLGRVTDFWSSIWQAAAENQKLLIEQVNSQMGRASETLRESAIFTTRSSEEVARAAANQVSRAAGSIRESAPAANKPEGHRKSA